ncbi:MAG: aromatic ring-hydroxylating oxygenase subunit alpha [Litorivicinus sp.]
MKIPMIDLDRVQDSIEHARGLPNRFYTDPQSHAQECDAVFAGQWAAAAFASDVPQDGSVYPVQLAGMPLLVVKDRQQEIRVFHNVCSHRGVKLAEQPETLAGMLCCPYHSWTYDLTGKLVATPHVGGVGQHSVEGLACEEHGLKQIRSHIWMGIIFVDLAGTAEAFEDRIAPLYQRWDEFFPSRDYDLLEPDPESGTWEQTLDCNWKLAVENYCEAYHLPWIHPALNTYSKIDDHYNIVDQSFSGQGSTKYRLSEHEGYQLPKLPGWPEQRIENAEYISLFPNVLLGLQADHAFAMILLPQGSEQTLERLRLFYMPGVVGQDSTVSARQSVLNAWQEVFTEDIGVVEAMQRGRHSPGFDGGKFSPVMDPPTHAFHKWVAQQLQKQEASEQ